MVIRKSDLKHIIHTSRPLYFPELSRLSSDMKHYSNYNGKVSLSKLAIQYIRELGYIIPFIVY